MRLLSTYLIGLVFGLGIAVSGMIDPAKVLNFFDFFGIWDPSLALVMAGALGVTLVGYFLVFERARPLFAERFVLPSVSGIDSRLLAGAAIFGVGWGLAGFCPGGALPALGTGRAEVFVFLAALIAGLFVARLLTRTRQAGGTPKAQLTRNPEGT